MCPASCSWHHIIPPCGLSSRELKVTSPSSLSFSCLVFDRSCENTAGSAGSYGGSIFTSVGNLLYPLPHSHTNCCSPHRCVCVLFLSVSSPPSLYPPHVLNGGTRQSEPTQSELAQSQFHRQLAMPGPPLKCQRYRPHSIPNIFFILNNSHCDWHEYARHHRLLRF